MRHDHWRTIDFDLGIHDQSIWLLSRFKDFVTVRGLPVFGHHATFAYFFLVPLAWLGAGPDVWNLLQVVAIATSAIPIFLLARDRLRNPWLATTLAVAWLLQPPLQFFAWETFHPEVMAIPFLLWAYWAAERDRRVLYWIMVVVALSWKEDVALFILMLGVLQLLRKRTRLGMLTIGLALVWFAVFALWMVPAMAGGGTVYGPLYGSLGDTPGEVVKTAFTDPGAVLDRLTQNDALGYARDLMAPLGFTPLAAPLVLLLGIAAGPHQPAQHGQLHLGPPLPLPGPPDGRRRPGHGRGRGLARPDPDRGAALCGGLGGGLCAGGHRRLGDLADQPRVRAGLLALRPTG